MVARGGHASYLRGAITVLFALAAYLGGLQISKAIATQRAADVAKAGARAGIEQPAAEPGATKNPEAEPAADGPAAPNNPPDEAPRSAGEAMSRTVMPRAFSTWDFLSLAVAALLAYELGRGSGGVPANTAGSDPSKSVPAGTHPDA